MRYRLFSALAFAVAGIAASGAGAGEAPYRIGFRILRVPRPSGEPLVVALWYPTTAAPGGLTYHLPATEMASDATRDAPTAKGPFPLVVYSHGGGGSDERSRER